MRGSNARHRVHVDSGAVSVLLGTFILSLATIIIMNRWSVNLVRVILVLGLVILNAVSLTRVHYRLISRPRPMDYLLFLLNVLPYSYVLYPNPPLWLIIPITPLLVFILEALRGRGRGALANIAGTALLASTYTPLYVIMGGSFSIIILYVALTWLAYHTFSAVYVEGKLPFRRIKPWLSTVTWFTLMIPIVVIAIVFMGNVLLIIPLIEPSIRAVYAAGEGKINASELRVRIRRIGYGSLVESVVLMALLVVLLTMVHQIN